MPQRWRRVRFGQCGYVCCRLSDWLASRDIFFESQMAIFLAVMEVPAIMVGIILVRGISKNTEWKALWPMKLGQGRDLTARGDVD